MRGGGGGTWMLDGETVVETRATSGSLADVGMCDPGDSIPAVLVGVFICDGLAEENVDE